MLAVVFPRPTRALAGAFTALVCVAVVVPQLLESAQAGTHIDRLADRLIRLDPGARTNSYEVKLHCTNQVGSGYKD